MRRSKKATKKKRSDDDDEQKQATSKKQKPDESRKQIADGKSGSLDGIKLMFTGTFEMDRKTIEATAATYGAKVVSTVNQADYVVFGTKPGQAKVDAVKEKGIKSINEQRFMEWLKTGPQ